MAGGLRRLNEAQAEAARAGLEGLDRVIARLSGPPGIARRVTGDGVASVAGVAGVAGYLVGAWWASGRGAAVRQRNERSEAGAWCAVV